ncbi:AMP-binding protein [Sphingomonas colocasiae]|uniref:Long-chain-fatty-acid--CoA ligase n=1 Tax=Sphingomonas colocasiae TaxID=1848973 RepID=A0ABS7PK77_9SPHN|nr:AMP-binding protein [Sphingomonas colocasiae]MBY8821694.1 AMP-binding protein [Sphingomonas colocasiae]
MSDRRLVEPIAGHARDDIALIVAHPDGDETLSYGALLDGATGWRVRLAAAGLGRGDRVALWLPNIAAWPMIELAAAGAGLVVVPLNTRWRAAEVRHALAISRARVVVLPEDFCGIPFDEILDEALDGLGDVARIRVPQRAVAHEGGAEPAPIDEDLPLNLLTTSGSTGTPKFAIHRRSALVTRFSAAGDRFTIERGDRLLCILPMCGVWGLGIVLAGLLKGATCVLAPVFDPDHAAALMGRLGIAHLHGGDNLVLSLIASAALDVELPLWRTCYFGAFTGRAALETIAAIETKGGGALCAAQAYGSSEALAFVAGCAPDAPRDDRARPGGPLVDEATEVRLGDPETGAPLIGRDAGEIQLRGATVATGYWGDDDATRAARTADGWYRTGDLGRIVPGGVVFISRLGDSLRLNGNLVAAGEIENHLCAHDAVAEAHVVGVRTLERGDVAVAFVRLAEGEGVDEAALLAFARGRMAGYKIPARIVVDVEIPVTIGANGTKVRKNVLRALAEGYLRTPPTT